MQLTMALMAAVAVTIVGLVLWSVSRSDVSALIGLSMFCVGAWIALLASAVAENLYALAGVGTIVAGVLIARLAMRIRRGPRVERAVVELDSSGGRHRRCVRCDAADQ